MFELEFAASMTFDSYNEKIYLYVNVRLGPFLIVILHQVKVVVGVGVVLWAQCRHLTSPKSVMPGRF